MMELIGGSLVSLSAFLLGRSGKKEDEPQEVKVFREFLFAETQMEMDAAEARSKLRLLEEQARHTRVVKKPNDFSHVESPPIEPLESNDEPVATDENKTKAVRTPQQERDSIRAAEALVQYAKVKKLLEEKGAAKKQQDGLDEILSDY